MKNFSLIFFYVFLISLQIHSQINLFEINDNEFNNLTNDPENSLSLSVDQNQLNFIKENKCLCHWDDWSGTRSMNLVK